MLGTEYCARFHVFEYYHTFPQCVLNLNTSLYRHFQVVSPAKTLSLNRVSAIFFIYFFCRTFESIWKGGSTKRALGVYCTRKWSVLSEQESDFHAVVFQLKYYKLYPTTWITYPSYQAIFVCLNCKTNVWKDDKDDLLALTQTCHQCAAPWRRVLASLFEIKILPMYFVLM